MNIGLTKSSTGIKGTRLYVTKPAASEFQWENNTGPSQNHSTMNEMKIDYNQLPKLNNMTSSNKSVCYKKKFYRILK